MDDAGDKNQNTPSDHEQKYYAQGIGMERKKFRTQQVKREEGYEAEDDLLEDIKENCSSLKPKIQALFLQLINRIIDDQVNEKIALEMTTGKASAC